MHLININLPLVSICPRPLFWHAICRKCSIQFLSPADEHIVHHDTVKYVNITLHLFGERVAVFFP